MTVEQLCRILNDWPSDTQIVIRYVEASEGVQHTADLTTVDQYEESGGDVSLLLVGDVDKCC